MELQAEEPHRLRDGSSATCPACFEDKRLPTEGAEEAGWGGAEAGVWALTALPAVRSAPAGTWDEGPLLPAQPSALVQMARWASSAHRWPPHRQHALGFRT